MRYLKLLMIFLTMMVGSMPSVRSAQAQREVGISFLLGTLELEASWLEEANRSLSRSINMLARWVDAPPL